MSPEPFAEAGPVATMPLWEKVEFDDVDRAQQRRAAAHADAVAGVVMEIGIGDDEVIEVRA